jgi:hypothetical protein
MAGVGAKMDDETRQELLDIENALERLAQNEDAVFRKIRPLTDEMELIRAKALLEIAQAKDETGRKPLYPNQKVRDAALTVRLHEDPQYQALLEQRRPLNSEIEEIRIERTKLSHRKSILSMGRGPFGLF